MVQSGLGEECNFLSSYLPGGASSINTTSGRTSSASLPHSDMPYRAVDALLLLLLLLLMMIMQLVMRASEGGRVRCICWDVAALSAYF